MKITVLYGGPSAEREVSLISGKAVAEALARVGHAVYLADIVPDDLSALDREADIVFPVLHGPWGEDGQLQRILDDRGWCYPGSGPAASAAAMDKMLSKQAFEADGLPTPAGRTLSGWGDGCWTGGLPAVVKPVDQGSSVDLTIARSPEQLRSAVQTVCGKYGRAMVEQFVAGRELTVGVLDGRALPAIEIVVQGHEFYDYQAKYFDDATQYLIEPPLPAGVSEELGELALAAHECLGCRDFSRVDFILGPDGQPVILEVNTIPGFTSHSLLPKAAGRAGLTFDALCDRLAGLAWQRARQGAGRPMKL